MAFDKAYNPSQSRPQFQPSVYPIWGCPTVNVLVCLICEADFRHSVCSVPLQVLIALLGDPYGRFWSLKTIHLSLSL
jgi:hypothetical protein